MLLTLRSLFWAIVLPGTITVYIPSLILRGTEPPDPWGVMQWLALLVGVPGSVILVHCIVAFAVVGGGTLSPADAPRQLVVRGLYRYVRNPMYFGVCLILLAEGAFFDSAAMLEYTGVCMIGVHMFVVLYEEPRLREEFGESYERYCRAVHRWRPGRPYDAGHEVVTKDLF
jgi:protein-S-isoprenylcysteine O-methyltransferase Ste14